MKYYLNEFLLILTKLICCLFFILIYCEFLVYYVVIYQCDYNKFEQEPVGDGLKTMILADTHMLGPFRGHPFDKLRREWQMRRSFQTAVKAFEPDVVIILGDVFDEGNWVDQIGFAEYVDRFHSIFKVPNETRLYAVHGNHDINFHYRLHPYLISRFNQAFNTSGVKLIREKKTTKDGIVRKINFVTVNSMALERDGCGFCSEAENEIKSVRRKLEKLKQNKKYSRPILLQHFPTFRKSDENCLVKNSINNDEYREKWETLSNEATKFLDENLEPRIYLSGHSHHYCEIKNSVGVDEFTIASFNWRNLNNPSFILAIFTPDNYSTSLCELPKETSVFGCYVLGLIVTLLIIFYDVRKIIRKNKKIR